MKRNRTLCVLLALLLALSALPAPAAAADLFFVAVNDSIPLTLTILPYDAGSTLYVPYQVFDSRPGGVTPSYTQSENSFILFTRSLRLYFDLAENSVTDESGKAYDATVTYRNGVLYLPLSFCAAHFGLKAAMLQSSAGYPVLRFTTGSEVYDDDLFIEKAENLIAYRAGQSDQTQPPDTQPVTPVTQDPQPEQKPDDPPDEPPLPPAVVYLAFADAASMRETMQALESAQLRGAFFLTEQEIRSDPALVRELLAAGHRIGLRPEPDAEDLSASLLAANNALDEVILQRSLLVLLPEGADAPVGFCFFTEPAEPLTAQEVAADHENAHLLVCTSDAAETLSVLSAHQADIRMLRETTDAP